MPSADQLKQVIRIHTEIARLGLGLGDIMAFVVEQTPALIGADGAVVELAEGDEMVYRAAAGIAQGQIGLRLKIDGSLSGLCVRGGEILHCPDSETDPRVDRQACQQVGLRSMLVVPLTHKGVTVGVLKAISQQANHFTPVDASLLGMLSDVIGAAMYNSVRYDLDELFHKATHDGMTGLANRALFMDRLRGSIAQGQREHRPVGVLIIDMDGLKQINDSCGHRAGDAVIVEFAQRVKVAARSSDTVARLGGDEFGVLLTPVEEPEDVEAAVDRIGRQIDAPFAFEGREYALRASIGAAISPQDSREMDELLELADQRMYARKSLRRGALSVD
ncbi:MAG: sensor domain-containing diguanylate cyclase [Rhodocyclales bacterium GT-UBC]|nr:MAG: sensor domain-containing diguanylate cyclase [Rhodocyclales bacterium GT-UBC]